jgi:AraC family transcriptional regulator, transcriptional activator of pobA
MATKGDTIPVHRLGEHTDQGYQLEKMHAFNKEDRDAMVMDLHRDDHYIFLLCETGVSKAVIDFEHFSIPPHTLVCVLPGQVHSYYDVEEGITGWFAAMAPGTIPEAFRAVLEDPLLSTKPLPVCVGDMDRLTKCLELANDMQERPVLQYSRQAVYFLLASFTAMVAELYAGRQGAAPENVSRSRSINQEFRAMLAMKYKTVKSAGEYASALHLSLSYLNEAVKEATGFTVSYWIQQEILLEAKRLLYYSGGSVKEIAHELGYDDHAYFSRLFKRVVGKTPGAFRAEFGRV